MEAPQLRRINLGFLATLAQLQAAFSVRRLSEQCSLVFANARSWQKSLHENQPCPIASKFRLGATRPASNAQCLTVKRESFLQSLPVVRGDFTTRCKCKDCETPGLPVVSTAAREPLLTAGNPGQVPRPPRGPTECSRKENVSPTKSLTDCKRASPETMFLTASAEFAHNAAHDPYQ